MEREWNGIWGIEIVGCKIGVVDLENCVYIADGNQS